MKPILCLILILLIGCSKKIEDDGTDNHNTLKIDTIFPKEYFPVYPNSYWKYVTSNNDTVIHKTDQTYSLNSNYDYYGNNEDYSFYYAPKYDGHTVRGYCIFLGTTDYHSSRWKTIIDNDLYVGKLFNTCVLYPMQFWYGKVISLDTTIVINSNTFHSVNVIMEFEDLPGDWFYYSKSYYAKNIGIIKYIEWFSADSSTYEENLIEYKINN